jgi:hypothetical protein
MPDSSPARIPTPQALDESLAALFRGLEAMPASLALLELADRLEDAWRGEVPAEARTLGL